MGEVEPECLWQVNVCTFLRLSDPVFVAFNNVQAFILYEYSESPCYVGCCVCVTDLGVLALESLTAADSCDGVTRYTLFLDPATFESM